MRTVQNGRFAFPARVNRDYLLSLQAPGFLSRSLNVKLPTTERYVDLGDVKMMLSDSKSGSSTPQLPSDVLRSIQADVGISDSDDCLRRNGLQFEQMIRTTWFSLAPKTADALLVEGLGPCIAGANNGTILVYRHLGESWQKVLDVSGAQVNTVPHQTHGLLDLVRWQHSSAFESVRFLYEFDGREYEAVRCEVVEFADPSTAKQYPKPKYMPCTWDWKQ